MHRESLPGARDSPETKYASEGGPALKDGSALLRRVALRPAIDILRLLDAVIFNLTSRAERCAASVGNGGG